MSSGFANSWIRRMRDHDLAFLAAVGDQELGDNPWHGERWKRGLSALKPNGKSRVGYRAGCVVQWEGAADTKGRVLVQHGVQSDRQVDQIEAAL